MQICNVYEDEFIYIPSSGKCLLNILVHNYPDRENELNEKIDKYCKDNGIYRHNIRYCDLINISNLIDIKIDYLRYHNRESENKTNRYKPRQLFENPDIMVIIIDRHYIQIKKDYN